jgi:kumamolisin
MNHTQLASDYGTSDSDFRTVRAFAKEYHLQVLDEDPLSCSVKVSGRIQDLERAFETTLRHVQVGKRMHRERTGPLTLPEEVAPIIEGVFGLDDRAQVRPHVRPSIRPRAGSTYTPMDMAKLYNFPNGDGSGETVAILEFGGGYTNSELSTYFTSLGITMPQITAVLLPGAQNLPTPAPAPTQDNPNPPDPDAEVVMDIEAVGAIAPKAHIKVYFAKDATDKSFVDCIDKAINDKPTVISISWGGPESTWQSAALTSIDKSLARAAAMSIPVTVASGDDGSTDGTSPTILDVDFPCSSPHALACGGTRLEGKTTIINETVWNSNGGATGGGVSSKFKKPDYQVNVDVPAASTSSGGRGVPDVCGNADPDTGFDIQWDGKTGTSGGTSAVAPLWAALIAILAQKLGHNVPFLNSVLYANSGSLHDITEGSNDLGDGNGHYKAQKGWDACTGLGSPDGNSILRALTGQGTTKTTSTHHTTTSHTTPHTTHPTEHTTTHTSTKPHTTMSSSGSSGTTSAPADWFELPPSFEPEPVAGESAIPEEAAEAELPIGQSAQLLPALPANIPARLLPSNSDQDGIVAIVGMVSNVANTAITALTAIATHRKSNS